MKATPEQVEEILSYPTCTVEQAASVFGIGRGHAYRMAKAGELPVIKFGQRIVVKTAGLRQMVGHNSDAA